MGLSRDAEGRLMTFVPPDGAVLPGSSFETIPVDEAVLNRIEFGAVVEIETDKYIYRSHAGAPWVRRNKGR